MKSGYKTIASLKSECTEFANKVLELDFSNLSDQLLKEEIASFGDNITLAALVLEVVKRKMGLTLFKCQLETAFALYNGHIAELPTGEGKTLSGVLAAILYAKSGRKTHILVFNDYLARRDATDNKEIFEFFNVSVSYITETSSVDERKFAYNCDVLYISAREAGYDYIRNFVVFEEEDLLGEYDAAIVDEADSILIDEAAIPLVLAGNSKSNTANEIKIVGLIKDLNEDDFEVNEQENSVWLTDLGIEKVESALLIENLYGEENTEILSDINTALQAVYLLECDKDYIVKDGNICVIDESTGRIAQNRKFPNRLHKFTQAKEGITDDLNTRIYCSMTIGAFLEQYKTLSGMTGTAHTSANELESTYSLRTLVIEPHTPCIREDLPDLVFATNEERDNAVISDIMMANAVGQPVLVGTASVKESEKISALLEEKGIKHSVLNARNDELEAGIIAKAGAPYSVTVSTNMAGRGVDIKLGGANEEEKEFVSSVGGLYVISTTVNRSRRIDNQLKGRAGRQGDIGKSKFFISLEDQNISPFFEESPEDKSTMTQKEKFSLVRSAQKTLEGNEAEARYTLKKYSYILEHQRKILTEYRVKLLKGETVPEIAKDLDYDYYLELSENVTAGEIERAETALSLYFINQHFASFLEAMEEVKSGIHLTMVGGKNPFDEFNRIAIESFEEMNSDIRFDVLEKLKESRVEDGKIILDLTEFDKNTGTWTYMVDDSADQFSHLPELMNMISNKIKKTLTFSEKFENFLNKRKEKKKAKNK